MNKTKWKLAKGKTWRMKLEQENPSHGKTVLVRYQLRGEPIYRGDLLFRRVFW